MLFKLKNPASGRVTHCGVLEFTAKEGTMHLPSWMMENLLLEEGDIVKVKNVSLPAGTYMQLQPHTKNFLDITNPRAMSFSCLTTGDTIVIDYSNKKFYIDIVDTKPSAAVCIIDTDCEVDFAPPLDYEEAMNQNHLTSLARQNLESQVRHKLATKLIKFKPFTGSARRLDGKPISESVAVVSSSPMPQQPEDTDGTNGPTSSSSTTFQRSRKVVFGSKETSEAAPVASQKHPQEVEKPKFQAFTGKKYTLQD
ncbi:Ubiquitin recognition factor in ER-associated degradation protein 1 [Vitis vinifera]|uniref:Ubiquitin recognition factor in ER-associated degradation protein 1 n=1 Tax=Vitis vinifera TaxID=29760 RepID=A0A438G1E1_VITVI|nr:Ubiquitin recognition factor in ER-associated degradation protein 1 [Vitis vinifera]